MGRNAKLKKARKANSQKRRFTSNADPLEVLGVGAAQWAVEIVNDGTVDIIGEAVIATTQLIYKGRTWEGWVTPTNETPDGLSFNAAPITAKTDAGLAIEMQLYKEAYAQKRAEMAAAVAEGTGGHFAEGKA